MCETAANSQRKVVGATAAARQNSGGSGRGPCLKLARPCLEVSAQLSACRIQRLDLLGGTVTGLLCSARGAAAALGILRAGNEAMDNNDENPRWPQRVPCAGPGSLVWPPPAPPDAAALVTQAAPVPFVHKRLFSMRGAAIAATAAMRTLMAWRSRSLLKARRASSSLARLSLSVSSRFWNSSFSRAAETSLRSDASSLRATIVIRDGADEMRGPAGPRGRTFAEPRWCQMSACAPRPAWTAAAPAACRRGPARRCKGRARCVCEWRAGSRL